MDSAEPIKRKPGRPRKHPLPEPVADGTPPPPPKKRGRPRKNASTAPPDSSAPAVPPAPKKRRGSLPNDPASDKLKYLQDKKRAARRSLERSRAGRDIGEIPPVKDPVRKEQCRTNFRLFCEQYFGAAFSQDGNHWPWSHDHLEVFDVVQNVVLHGGCHALAMPRGGGKTTICESAVLWAVSYAYHPFVGIIGPDDDHAKGRIDNFQAMLLSQPFCEDFPEISYPIEALEGTNHRKLLYNGDPVLIQLKKDRIKLPDISVSQAAGSIIYSSGITGGIRGPNVRRSDGTVMRPSFVLIDDPQTRESARSPQQCLNRERIITADILGLAGPGKKISALMTCTVISGNDLADRVTDCVRNPHWQGIRTKMVLNFPVNESVWTEYSDYRKKLHQTCRGQPGRLAEFCNKFYIERRDEMDEGAEVSWDSRKLAEEVSAIQHAMNLRIDLGDTAFFSEYQNDPLPEEISSADMLTADEIMAKQNGHERGIVPLPVTLLTGFIDIHKDVLYYLLLGCEPDFTSYIVDYGCEPEQKTDYFLLRDARHTLAMSSPAAGLEGAIYAGLDRLTERILGREWKRDDGAAMRIERCMIDANWGKSTAVIKKFCRQSRFSAILMPSHGKYFGAATPPMDQQKSKRGDRIGLNWRIPSITGKAAVRHCLWDTNFWKSFVHQRLQVPMGDTGCLSLFSQKNPEAHRMLAEHLVAEYSVLTEGRGRKVDEWKMRADAEDNHFLDCLVGATVAAAMGGANLAENLTRRQRPRRGPRSIVEMARKARERRETTVSR